MEFVRDTEQQMSIFSSESPQHFLLNSIRLITENRIFTEQEKSYSSEIHSHRDVQHAGGLPALFSSYMVDCRNGPSH